MEQIKIRKLAYLMLHYYTVEDVELKLNKLTEDERQDVLEEMTALVGRR